MALFRPFYSLMLLALGEIALAVSKWMDGKGSSELAVDELSGKIYIRGSLLPGLHIL